MLLNDIYKNHKLILASQSPRRKLLLEGLDIPFEVIVRKEVTEDYPTDLGMIEIPEYLARSKSDFYLDLVKENTLLITADTIVWHNNRVLGKPDNLEATRMMLGELSGKMHEVITGVCLRSHNKIKIFHSVSKVWFCTLSEEEIAYYAGQYKPFDKAGAYGIQEWIGYIGIEKIEGSFYNVMGLPIQKLYHELLHYL